MRLAWLRWWDAPDHQVTSRAGAWKGGLLQMFKMNRMGLQ
jgi:hypothetical protein